MTILSSRADRRLPLHKLGDSQLERSVRELWKHKDDIPVVTSPGDYPTAPEIGMQVWDTSQGLFGAEMTWDGTAWRTGTAGGLPGPHVLATTSAIGPQHTVSGLTAGQVLQAINPADVAFQFLDASKVAGGQTLSRTNDTNVTLTLGGLPSAALLTAVSLTLGWSGQLALSRGGTAADLSATGPGAVVQNSAAAALSVATTFPNVAFSFANTLTVGGRLTANAGLTLGQNQTLTFTNAAGTIGQFAVEGSTNAAPIILRDNISGYDFWWAGLYSGVGNKAVQLIGGGAIPSGAYVTVYNDPGTTYAASGFRSGKPGLFYTNSTGDNAVLTLISDRASSAGPENSIAAFGFGGNAQFGGIRGNGTAASPTVVISGDVLMALHGGGFYASNTTSFTAGTGNLRFLADENWSSTNKGTRAELILVATGGTASSTVLTAYGSGLVVVGTDPVGSGTEKLRVGGEIYTNNGVTIKQDQNFQIDRAGAHNAVLFQLSATDVLYLSQPNNANLIFRTGAADKLVLDHTNAALKPASSKGLSLGTSALPWGAGWIEGDVVLGGADPGNVMPVRIGNDQGLSISNNAFMWGNVAAANSFQRFGISYGIYWNVANGNYTVTDTSFNQATFTDENGTFVWTMHSGALTSPQTYANWHSTANKVMTLSSAGALAITSQLSVGSNQYIDPAGSEIQISDGTRQIRMTAATSARVGTVSNHTFFLQQNNALVADLTAAAFSPHSSALLTLGTSPLPWGASFFGAEMKISGNSWPNCRIRLVDTAASGREYDLASRSDGGDHEFSISDETSGVALQKFNAAHAGLFNYPVSVAYGAYPGGDTAFLVGASGTTTDTYGIRYLGVTPATSTNSSSGVNVQMSTAAAVFSTTLYGINIFDANKGSGSTITTQYGLYVNSQTKGTTNYAIYTNTGAIRFGDSATINASGVDGLTIVGNNSNRAGVFIQSGTSQQSQILLGDGSTPKWQIGKQTDNTFFMYDSANSDTFLTIGTAAASSLVFSRALTVSRASDGTTDHFFLDNLSTGTNAGPRILFRFADTSSNVVTAATIKATKDQSWTSTASTQDATLRFSVAINGTLVEQFRVDQNGATVSGTLAATLLTASQPNITSVGNLIQLYVRAPSTNNGGFVSVGRASAEDVVLASLGTIDAGGYFSATAAGDSVIKASAGNFYIGAGGGTTYIMKFTSGGGVQIGAPTGGDKGAGTLNVATDLYKNGTAYTNPDYVLEHWARGRITRHWHKEGAREYQGLMPLPEVDRYVRKHFSLPHIQKLRQKREWQGTTVGLFDGGEAVQASVEEAYLHLIQLERRIAALELKLAA